MTTHKKWWRRQKSGCSFRWIRLPTTSFRNRLISHIFQKLNKTIKCDMKRKVETEQRKNENLNKWVSWEGGSKMVRTVSQYMGKREGQTTSKSKISLDSNKQPQFSENDEQRKQPLPFAIRRRFGIAGLPCHHQAAPSPPDRASCGL